MRSFAQSKRLTALLGGSGLAASAPAVALVTPAGRSAGRALPHVVHGGSLGFAGAMTIVAVVAASILVAVIGWRFDRRRVSSHEQAVAVSGRETSRGPAKAGAAPSVSRIGAPAGARARRVAPRDGEERR